MSETLSGAVPGWVPEGAKRYLAHTECGRSIRELARRAGCHASTVMRQIRRIETRRDDPLVDAALAALAARCPSQEAPAPGAARRGGGAGQNTPGQGKPGQGKSDQGKPGQNKPGQGQGGRAHRAET